MCQSACSRVRNRAKTNKPSLEFHFPVPEGFGHRIIAGNVCWLLGTRQTQLMRQLSQESRFNHYTQLSPAERNQWLVYDFKITYEEMQWLNIAWEWNGKDLTWVLNRNFCHVQKTNISKTNIFRERIYVWYIHIYKQYFLLRSRDNCYCYCN